MILADVNILIHAFRRDMPQHARCLGWLRGVVGGEAPFGVSPLVLSAVARITTNPRIFREPSTVDEAIGFGDDLLSQPHCTAVQPGDRHWAIFRRLSLETGISGARIADAWLAALAIEWACEWITLDRDFARFPGLRCAEP